jgi:hypothetical protein
MNSPVYSLEAWRRLREPKNHDGRSPEPAESPADISGDAPMDGGIVLGCWNGERFVSFKRWLATAPLDAEAETVTRSGHTGGSSWSAICGGHHILLTCEGDRWLMHVAAGSQTLRRKDFASPSLEHAQRTAEAWYGPVVSGWHPGGPNVQKMRQRGLTR